MNERAYHVLVGGEHHSLQGGPVDQREFLHTSVSFVGQAYSDLRSAGVSRDQIIVIAQIQDHLNATLAGEQGQLPHTGIKPIHYQSHRERFEASCRRLIDEGGADYDFTNVNPLTLWNVLLGIGDGKVVPKEASSIHLAVYSHGNSQSTVSNPSSQSERDEIFREWYFNFPHPCPPEALDIYSFVALSTFRHGYHNFYVTQLKQLLIMLFAQNPTRPIVCLLNFCRSGGATSFIKQSKHESNTWPLAVLTSSQKDKDSLVCGLWESWFSELKRLSKSEATIGQCWKGCESKYYKDNSFELMNHIKERCYPPKVFRLKFKFDGSNDGSIDPWHLDLQQALHSNDPFTSLAKLQSDYLSGAAFRIVSSSDYSGNGSAPLNRKQSVVWVNHWSVASLSLNNSQPYPVQLVAWQGPNEGDEVDLCTQTKEAIHQDIACPEIVCGDEVVMGVKLTDFL